jgi:hypothetical protein
MTERHLHATGGTRVGKLVLQTTPLGCGSVLTRVGVGCSSKWAGISGKCRSLQGARAELPAQGRVFHIEAALPSYIIDFHATEELGCAPPPACSSCTGYQQCARRRRLSSHERAVLDRIEESVKLEDGRLVGSYPLKATSWRLRANPSQALAVQAKVEERAIRLGYFDQLQEAFKDMVEAGAVRELSVLEVAEFEDPANYVTIFPVFKDESTSTKLRLVSNSAMKNQRAGLSLNDVTERCSDLLNNLFGVLVNWWIVEHAVFFDLKKAYWQIATGTPELHLRRVAWRSGPGEAWRTYGFQTASFGDQAAGTLLEATTELPEEDLR